MNRLWVRISLVIACITIFITVTPLVTRPFWLRTFPPQRDSGDLLPAEIEAGLTEERIAEFEARAWENLWQSLALSGLVGLVVGVLLSRSLVKPLNELEKGAHEIANQNLAHRVSTVGSREVRSVATAFNDMATKLERAQTLRRNILADVTHELRHPVHVLKGNLLGIMDGVFPLEMEEIVFLEEQTQQLSQLINDLHELALAEAHELPIYKQITEVNGLVQDSVDAVRPLAIAKQIMLHASLSETPVSLTIDGPRIKQVMQNLLSNAIRYTPEGGEVSISLESSAVACLISVHDTGIGITAGDLPHVFDRFYRSDSSRDREQRGAGLGLAIVKAIVESHDGRVEATSPGEDLGSTFQIILPVSPPQNSI